jgi:putative tryptophan/tyrosine transport system substrate-binding protein
MSTTLIRCLVGLLIVFATASIALAQTQVRRIFIVSSYHKEYLWSVSTQQGLVEAMLRYGYLDDPEQGRIFTRDDHVESSRAVIRKAWMDTKRQNRFEEMARATARIMEEIRRFRPDLVMLGDDNAANYIGQQLLGTDTPVVFWGINGLPLKYGLVDSMDMPGHNVTGVWQAGYFKESLVLLKHLVPSAQTFAILACDSESTRPHIKRIQLLAEQGELPLRLVETVRTNSFERFKAEALRLARVVDAFFILNHDTMADDRGEHVDMMTVGRWYLETIRLPEASHEDQFVHEGMLLTANDSGYNQSFAAFEMAYDILEQGLNPGRMRTRTPPRGPYLVNRQRAQALGISIEDKSFLIDEVIERSLALSN